uniref:DZANK-type domain-containing protein n=1 Tax=Panagrolaimus sp. JU765 TaxID=591449 RepID=A0AC34QF79_9BILA
MPLAYPKLDANQSTPSHQPSTSSVSPLECPSCAQPVASSSDQFCRHCGLRILMRCSKCSAPVRPADKFCAACGCKRWQFLELWRYGILHRSPIFVIGVTAAAAVGYLTLCFFLKRRARA